MTRIALVSGLCLLAAAGSAAAGSHSAAGKTASLHAIDLQPLVVRGTGFVPGERVQLLASGGEGYQWRTKVAGSSGTLTARFGFSVGACARFSVFAVGSRGSRARIFPLRMQLECVSPARGGIVTQVEPRT